MKNFKFEMGVTLKCLVTGFSGVCIGRVQYLTGCNQYLLKPKSTDNKMPDGIWIDENSIELVEGVEKITLDTSGEVGACEAPSRN